MITTNLNQTLRPTFNLLKITFGVVAIVAGLDKFFNLLTQWGNYLSPDFAGMLPLAPNTIMLIVGVIEMIAGIMVIVKPEIGGYIVAGWLTVISLSLIVNCNYL